MRHVNGLPYGRKKLLARRVTGNGSNITISNNDTHDGGAQEFTFGMRMRIQSLTETSKTLLNRGNGAIFRFNGTTGQLVIDTSVGAAVTFGNADCTPFVGTGKLIEAIGLYNATGGARMFFNGSEVAGNVTGAGGTPDSGNGGTIAMVGDLDSDIIDLIEAFWAPTELTDAQVARIHDLQSWYKLPLAGAAYNAAENIDTLNPDTTTVSTVGATLIYTDPLMF